MASPALRQITGIHQYPVASAFGGVLSCATFPGMPLNDLLLKATTKLCTQSSREEWVDKRLGSRLSSV